MPVFRRRRLLRTFGTLAVAGTLAGCLDETGGGDGDGSDDRLRGDAVVDYPGMVDGEASVSSDEGTIEYDDPEVTFELTGGYRGETADESELRVSRDLAGETMAGFVAPVAGGDDGEFEFHVFANEAFVEFADWNVVGGPLDREPESHGDLDLEHLGDEVYGAVVDPVEVDVLLVVDASAAELDGNSDAEPSGIVVRRDPADGLQPASPNVAFGFEYDADAERLEVRHEGGDGVEADELRFVADEDLRVLEDFESDVVQAGDRSVVSVPPEATVRVVWESGDDDQSSTLARWSGSEA